jgi:hypothetical protein
MAINRVWLAALLLGCLSAQSQVLAPAEIADPSARNLQEKYFSELKDIGLAIRGHKFPYHFYLSRKLDLSEAQQLSSDQRAIQFDNYQGQVVLKITGNYYASLSADLMTDYERARTTYLDVMLPVLLEAVPKFNGAAMPQSFALEISHHTRKRVLGVTTEQAENVVLILPKAAAERLVAAKDESERRSAVLEGTAFVNANPIGLWPEDEKLLAVRHDPEAGAAPLPIIKAAARVNSRLLAPMPERAPVEATAPPAGVTESALSVSPDLLKKRDTAYQPEIEKMLKELDAQAHFVSYAPPSFMTFRNGVYLQVSLTTPLGEEEGASLYRMAALAFDRHIAHLIRPIMTHFKDCDDFSGIDFSTSIRSAGKGQENGSVEAVEYVFSLSDLRRYENFDITGQDLIRSGFVLVNGERISLELQEAEGKR